jgi:predicted secreted Zn-dependent protease
MGNFSVLLPIVAVFAACSGRIASSASLQSVPGLRIDAHESFYQIEGASARELHRAMVERGPALHGVALYASNEWRVDWEVRNANPGRRSCRPDARVVLFLRTVLPRWDPPTDAPDSLVRAWRRFEAAVLIHENGHRDLGVRAGKAVWSALRNALRAGCSVSSEDLTQAAATALQRYHELSQQYDVDTEHGRTQGVVWPPGSDWIRIRS